jgi:hypothetical protein
LRFDGRISFRLRRNSRLGARPGPQPVQSAREPEEWEWDGAYFFLMPPDLEDDEEDEVREPELWEELDTRDELEMRVEPEL